jgi:hypothetical protein
MVRAEEEKDMKTRMLSMAAAASLLAGSSALAQDSSDAAHRAMHEAMHDQASMPARPAAMPHQAMKPGMGQDQMHGTAGALGQAMMPGTGHSHMNGTANASGQAVQHPAMHQGTRDATATHADAANRPGMDAATSGAMGSHGDMHDAANNEEMKEMHGGMTGSGTGGGMHR